MIYFDNAATTKPVDKCLKLAEEYFNDNYYNPSALYRSGYGLNGQLKAARSNIIKNIADENKFTLIFTSCGTEADNQAIFNVRRGNIVTTLGEHAAVNSAVLQLQQSGFDVRFAKLNPDGSVNVENLLGLIDEKTSLVSVIHVNNETGAVNDIRKISEEVKRKNKFALFHSDGVQAFGKVEFSLTDNIDLYSVSAHKIGGVKGCGALIKKKSLQIRPYIYGGGQESGLRSGTENVFAIKCFEYATQQKYERLQENYQKVKALNSFMRKNLDKSLFTVISGEYASPYILSVAANGVRGETILHEADDKGLIIGTGSACSSNSKKRYSRVILSCGIDEKTADGILRISFSDCNTLKEAEEAVKILNETVRNRKEKMA